jgi:hypothetical protein
MQKEEEIIQKFFPKTLYIKGVNAVVIFTSKDYFKENNNPIPLPLSADSKKKYRGAVPWGTDNNLPQTIIELINKNGVASPSIEHLIDVAYGSGVKFGINNDSGEFVEATQAQKESVYKEIDEFFENNDLTSFYAELISDLRWFYNGFVELILNKDDSAKRKIVELSCKEAAFSRWETCNPDTGIVENHFYSAKWDKGPTAKEYITTPVIWGKNPTKELKERIGRIPNSTSKAIDEKEYRYILPIRLPSPGRTYYPRPYWYSVIDSGWIDFSNKIAEFKKSFMSNSMTIAYHVQIEEGYFPKQYQKEGLKTKKEQETFYNKTIEDIKKYLQGSENSGKSMITYFKFDRETKVEVPEIKINVIDKKIGGEYIEDSHEASAMIAYAMRVHPSLIGVIPGKTSANLSGSDKRELLRIEQSLQQRLRQMILKPLYLVKAINNWPKEVYFSIPDVLLTTIDTGKEVQTVNF